MLGNFYQKFSLDNLKKDRPLGQVATILILMVVVILIMILTTVNLGQLSLYTTTLSNIADSSAMYLASQLATRSHALYQALGNSTCKCKSGGFGGLFGAIIGAIIVIVVTVVTYGAGTAPTMAAVMANTGLMVAAGVVGGAIGGAIGSSYSGTGILAGTIQGAMIGGAIGYGVSAGAGMGADVGGSSLSLEETEALLAMQQSGVQTEAGIAAASKIATASAVGAGAGGTLAVGAASYNAYVADQNQAAAFAAASRMLNGLPEYDRYRESIFLQVFSQAVDDPNKDKDTDDLNGNGIVDEKIPHFLHYWSGRMGYLKSVIPSLQSITNTFFNGTLEDFRKYMQVQILGESTGSSDPETGSSTYKPGILSKAGAGTNVTANGSVAEVAEALNPMFWNPQSNGSFDSIVSGFNSFISDVKSLQEIGLSRLTSQWQTYIKNFYNKDAGKTAEDGSTITDYYTMLGEVKGYLNDWKTQIAQKRNALPACKMGGWEMIDYATFCQPCGFSTFCPNSCIIDSGPEMSPMPCKFNFTLKGGTLDYNVDDEITASLNDIDTLINKISNFQDAIKQYVNDMENTYAALESGYGGLNPAIYSWADSRGDHSVRVAVGNYQLARTITTSSGSWLKKEICVRLVDYSDDGSNSWVQITRQDPKNKDVKTGKVSLGMWNPFFSGTITKKGRAYYSYDKVGLTQ
ncbi:MAG: Tad domain-containing protein [Candidatus Omnitrophica bacterium]|nr:Tad domain-containing protein [Candidatus Omnitrophota bacterium]